MAKTHAMHSPLADWSVGHGDNDVLAVPDSWWKHHKKAYLFRDEAGRVTAEIPRWRVRYIQRIDAPFPAVPSRRCGGEECDCP